ncbi:hypothetical protein CHS0354_014568 [Potamilus streckersoni]|uniref:Phospholipid/glycerol acyltransferase domain-containing protein n=1 Tax=Potamilus streckersoni TaxID=2493646 RepID=A0AAE0RNT7_9BIVA|nr:hypothetical protein CHS0354_014568 [Potamilus streckersoni]
MKSLIFRGRLFLTGLHTYRFTAAVLTRCERTNRSHGEQHDCCPQTSLTGGTLEFDPRALIYFSRSSRLLHTSATTPKMSEQSRNSWIKKDDPKLVSAKQKDFFVDMLDDRRHASDFHYSTRVRDVTTYKYNKPRSPKDIKDHVMQSDRVKYAVEKVMEESGLPLEEVMKQTQAILDEMAHNLRIGVIRCFAFFLVKVMKKLFQRIYINEEGVQKVRSLLKEYPILLMPSHRSYLDFLLMSYVFYEFDLPLPVIAAAMDFMGMRFFGWLLRNSGAFYIRRSFGDDMLYWAVFTEYIQTQICNGDSPVEFFVEGTRSRTSKSYAPKFGMLSAALEPYFKAQVPDIMIVPVSISYDKILEEKLYAYELLGVPKPKESASGLFKARNILKEDFGNVHIYLGEPVSIRQYSVTGNLDRSVHSLAPRYIVSLSDQEQHLIRHLSYDMVIQQQKHMVISPFAMIAAVLLQNREGIHLRNLVREVEWLKRQSSNLGAYIDWPVSETPETVLRASVSHHGNIVQITADDMVELIVEDPTITSNQDKLMTSGAQQLMLCLYKNQLMHIFVDVAMIAISINSCAQDTLHIEELKKHYKFLERLLNIDFIFLPGNTDKDFEQAMLVLTHTCGVVVENSHVQIRKSTNKYTTFFSQMFDPFLLGYWIMCRCLKSMQTGAHGKPLAKPPKVITKEAQNLSATLLRMGAFKHMEVLSLDMMNNGLQSLYHMGAVQKDKREGNTYMYPNEVVLSQIMDELSKFVDVPNIPATSINVETKTVVINAKL